MPRDVTEDMVREVLAEDAREPAVLITFEAEGLDEPILATSWSEAIQRTVTIEGVPTVQTFKPFPFRWSFPGASAEEPDRTARLEIANSDAVIGEAVRGLTGQAWITAELVRVVDPTLAEIAVNQARVTDIEIKGPSVVLTVKARDLAGVMACARRYVRARTPALF
jgi:hypothetical protein